MFECKHHLRQNDGVNCNLQSICAEEMRQIYLSWSAKGTPLMLPTEDIANFPPATFLAAWNVQIYDENSPFNVIYELLTADTSLVVTPSTRDRTWEMGATDPLRTASRPRDSLRPLPVSISRSNWALSWFLARFTSASETERDLKLRTAASTT